MPVYRSMTIRNWNTTTKLVQMLERLVRVSPRPEARTRTGRARLGAQPARSLLASWIDRPLRRGRPVDQAGTREGR